MGSSKSKPEITETKPKDSDVTMQNGLVNANSNIHFECSLLLTVVLMVATFALILLFLYFYYFRRDPHHQQMRQIQKLQRQRFNHHFMEAQYNYHGFNPYASNSPRNPPGYLTEMPEENPNRPNQQQAVRPAHAWE